MHTALHLAGKAAALVACLFFFGCGPQVKIKGSPDKSKEVKVVAKPQPQPKAPAPQEGPNTQLLHAGSFVGYDGTKLKKKMDGLKQTNNQRNEKIRKAGQPVP